MKLTKKQLIKIIKETIYVDPKGVAMMSKDIPYSVLSKDKRVAGTHPKIDSLMKDNNPESHMSARSLAMSLPGNEDLEYHGSENMYITNPERFAANLTQNEDEYSIIIFDIECSYEINDLETSEIDEDLLRKEFNDHGLICGKLPSGSYKGIGRVLRYVFGKTEYFGDDPNNFLQNLIDNRLNPLYSSEGFNRPCNHVLDRNYNYVIHLGSIKENPDTIRKIFIDNYFNLSSKQLVYIKLALLGDNKLALSELGVDDPEYYIQELKLNFMAFAAQNVLGFPPGVNTIVDDVTEYATHELAYPSYP